MLKSSSPFTFKYFSRTILSSVNVPVLSVQNMFIAPKFWIESSFLTIVFFFDILTAPLDKLEDKITGSNSGVMQMAIATAKVNAKIINIDFENKKIELSIRELEGTSQEYKENA